MAFQVSKIASARFGFLGVSVIAFLVSNIGFDVLAHIRVGGETLFHAIDETVTDAKENGLVSHFLLLEPFVVLGWASASIGVKRSMPSALFLFGSVIFVLGAMYFGGYMNSQRYMAEQKWTAAALSVGMLPLKGTLLVLAAWALTLIVVKQQTGRS